MKKAVFTILFASASFISMAQKFEIGVKAGADLNKLSGTAFKDQFSFGYQAGAFVNIGLTPKFGIQPELIFSQSRFDTTSSFKDVYHLQSVGSTKLNYMKIPILLNYSPNPFVTLQAGPQFGIISNASSSLVQNGKAAFKSGDFSMVGGLQLNISKFKVYGRYGIGLTNLNDIGSSSKWKNQNIQLGVGFKF